MISASSARHASVCGLQSWGSWHPQLPSGRTAAKINAKIIHMLWQRGDNRESGRRTKARSAGDGWNHWGKRRRKKSCRDFATGAYFHQCTINISFQSKLLRKKIFFEQQINPVYPSPWSYYCLQPQFFASGPAHSPQHPPVKTLPLTFRMAAGGAKTKKVLFQFQTYIFLWKHNKGTFSAGKLGYLKQQTHREIPANNRRLRVLIETH